jgi:membrane protease YdiL (CAAX protease family)
MGPSESKSLAAANAASGGLPPGELSGERFRWFAVRAKRGAVVGASLGAGVTLFEAIFIPGRTATVPFQLFLLVVNVVIGLYAGAALLGPVIAFMDRRRTRPQRSWRAAPVLLCAVIGASIGVVVWIKAVDQGDLQSALAEKIYLPKLAQLFWVPVACGAAVGVPAGLLLGTFWHRMALARDGSPDPSPAVAPHESPHAGTTRTQTISGDDGALPRETGATPGAALGGQAVPGSRSPAVDRNWSCDGGPEKEDVVFNSWDACQLALVFVLTQYMACAVTNFFGGALVESWPQPASLLAAQLAVVVFPVAWLFRLQPRARQLFNEPRPGRAELLALVALSIPFGSLLKYVARQPYLTCGLPVLAIDSPAMSLDTTLGLLSTVVIGPAIEEIFFRGIVGHSLIRRYRPVLGIVITAALFAATRAGRSQVAAAFILGVACHLAYFGTGSIVAAILLHALTNCFSPYFELANAPPLWLSALFATSALGYALCAGHIRPRAESGRADPHRPGSVLRSGRTFEGPPGRRFATCCLVLLSPLPFYCQMFYRLLWKVSPLDF